MIVFSLIFLANAILRLVEIYKISGIRIGNEEGQYSSQKDDFGADRKLRISSCDRYKNQKRMISIDLFRCDLMKFI